MIKEKSINHLLINFQNANINTSTAKNLLSMTNGDINKASKVLNNRITVFKNFVYKAKFFLNLTNVKLCFSIAAQSQIWEENEEEFHKFERFCEETFTEIVDSSLLKDKTPNEIGVMIKIELVVAIADAYSNVNAKIEFLVL